MEPRWPVRFLRFFFVFSRFLVGRRGCGFTTGLVSFGRRQWHPSANDTFSRDWHIRIRVPTPVLSASYPVWPQFSARLCSTRTSSQRTVRASLHVPRVLYSSGSAVERSGLRRRRAPSLYACLPCRQPLFSRREVYQDRWIPHPQRARRARVPPRRRARGHQMLISSMF